MNLKRYDVILVLTSYAHSFVIDEYNEIKKKIPNVILTDMHEPREILPVLLSNVRLLLLNMKHLIKCTKIIYSNFGVFPISYLVYLYFNLLYLFILDKKNGIKIIHAHWAYPAGLIAVTYSKIFPKKVIITTHGFDEDERTYGNEQLKKMVLHILSCAKWIMVGKKKSYLNLTNLGFRNVIYSQYFLDMAQFEKLGTITEVRKDLGIELDSFVVTGLSHLLRLYGVEDFMKIVLKIKEDIPNLMVICFGEGESRQELEDLFKQNNIKYRLTGNIPNDQVIEYLNACDVFCFTNHIRSGMIVLEASACSKPVVGYRLEEPDIEPDVTGLLADIGDTETLAKYILTLYHDETLRTRLGLNGRKMVETKYDKESRINTIIKAYAENKI